jgi:hypothetical protein
MSVIGAVTVVAIVATLLDAAIVDVEQHLIFSRPTSYVRRDLPNLRMQPKDMSLDPHLRWVEESRGVASPTRGSSRSGRLNGVRWPK